MRLYCEVTEEDERILAVAFGRVDLDEPRLESPQAKTESRAMERWIKLVIFISGVVLGACSVVMMKGC